MEREDTKEQQKSFHILYVKYREQKLKIYDFMCYKYLKQFFVQFLTLELNVGVDKVRKRERERERK